MFYINRFFNGMNLEVPGYISERFSTSADLRRYVRKLENKYGNKRFTLSASNLGRKSEHTYEAVKAMEDISFIEDGKKVVFAGKSYADSFKMYKHKRWKMADSKEPCLANRWFKWEDDSTPVEIRHSDKKKYDITENCYFMANNGRVGFLISTELMSSDRAAYYELFDLQKSKGDLNKQILLPLRMEFNNGRSQFHFPEIKGVKGNIVLVNYPIESCGELIEETTIFVPTHTSGDLLYDWKSMKFKKTNVKKESDLINMYS